MPARVALPPQGSTASESAPRSSSSNPFLLVDTGTDLRGCAVSRRFRASENPGRATLKIRSVLLDGRYRLPDTAGVDAGLGSLAAAVERTRHGVPIGAHRGEIHNENDIQ